jgi:gamma-glutamyltranspeptidase
VCSSSHETYVVDGSSILGKYSQAAVAVDNVECSKIGRQILDKGGKAMDAAIAAAICNGIYNAHSMGIGGGCIITVYSRYVLVDQFNRSFDQWHVLSDRSDNKAYSLIGVSRSK